MIIKNNYSLIKYNTFHLNAVAKKFYIPENEKELVMLLKEIKNKNEKYYILSGGSNILINENKEYENIIYMKNVDSNLIYFGDGKFYIGASSRIQEVINFVNQNNYGGFEELYGLPALFGGVVYMNAGIGSRKNPLFNISEYIENVKVIYIPTGEIKYLKNEECLFEYRKSIFQQNDYIILGAEINALPQEKEISKKRIENRLIHCRENQEWGKGCFGSCFSNYSRLVLKLIQIFNFNTKGFVQASNNPNWLINDGNASFVEVKRFIKNAFFWHKLFRKEIECEVRIWD